MIGFNKPFFTGKEIEYIVEAVGQEKISGNGIFTQRCQAFLEQRYSVPRVLLTTSCTAALEMAALLIDISPGDEVILPSFTFSSTANAFILRGAKVVFADSSDLNPNVDTGKLEALITSKTKAIVVVHYAGISCDMEKVMAIARQHNLFVIEDAAQGIESTYQNKPLGTVGHLGCFSFHETKNVIAGEGGALLINDEAFVKRAEILWEKGTNRSAFSRGEVSKYNWIDVGSSFLPSEITAAFLWAQLENISKIQERRQTIWNTYFTGLTDLGKSGLVVLPNVPSYCKHNAHIFYLVCRSAQERTKLLAHLNNNGVHAIFHYLSLHKSPYFSAQYKGKDLVQSDRYTSCLLRLPLYFDLQERDALKVTQGVRSFFSSH